MRNEVKHDGAFWREPTLTGRLSLERRLSPRKGTASSMYGTIAHMRPKAGHEQQIQDLLDQWNRDRKPNVKGTRGGYVLRPDRDPREVVLVAVFENRETYRANADDPDQDKWFRQLREHLEADPT
jgi:quinol monooxygenase YgiN